MKKIEFIDGALWLSGEQLKEAEKVKDKKLEDRTVKDMARGEFLKIIYDWYGLIPEEEEK